MSIPAILLRKSTGEIIKRGVMPILDPSEPVAGLDADLQWLIVYEPYAPPEYDERFYVLERIEAITTTPHPTWPLYNQFLVTYATNKRPVDEIRCNARNAEAMALQRVCPPDRQLKLLILALATIASKQANLQLTARQQAVLDELSLVANTFWQNDDIACGKLAAIAEGAEPDLDSGWKTALPTPTP